jgi:hypothetical protein
MSTIKIDVRQNPYYKGTKILDGVPYELRIHWNLTTEKWYLGIKGLTDDSPVEINGIALLPGKDLFAKHGYEELGQLWVVDNSGANEKPNYDEFGSRWTLEYTEK